MDQVSTDTSEISSWRSIITLIVFIGTNIIVLFPFHIPIPRPLSDAIQNTLDDLGIISPKPDRSQPYETGARNRKGLRFPMNFVTAPLIADLFLLAIQAIGRQEVIDGTLGADGILPYNIMIFFLTLAYIAISIDCSGLVRWLAFKVLERVQKQKGEQGKWLFFYLYVFFFALGSFIGNDPIILSGTAFIAYMTRVSKNIIHPRAWIHTQFAVANIASAILVSSNPTNLVLAGSFQIKFINYTANMIVPVLVTAVALFPFLLFLIFNEQALIPSEIEIHKLGPRETEEKPANPNIPDGRGPVDERGDEELRKEVLNPFMDRKSAAFGAFIMSTTLITLLVVNASDQDNGKEVPVFYITLPAAFVMFCWDLGWGWWKRRETRDIARINLSKAEDLRAQQELDRLQPAISIIVPEDEHLQNGRQATSTRSTQNEVQELVCQPQQVVCTTSTEEDEENRPVSTEVPANWQRQKRKGKSRIVAHVRDAYNWSRATFPTSSTVLSLLPYALLPFAFSMFVLVQGLVTKGWVAVFAYGWDYWVTTTGYVGAITGMAFLSAILCNFAGTNIGTTILLCRVTQTWKQIHVENGLPISDRALWGTIYAMALGVNYGAFSAAFSASLAGLLWRDILRKKKIRVRPLQFATNNLPIISIAMAVGCAALIVQVYARRSDEPYDAQHHALIG